MTTVSKTPSFIQIEFILALANCGPRGRVLVTPRGAEIDGRTFRPNTVAATVSRALVKTVVASRWRHLRLTDAGWALAKAHGYVSPSAAPKDAPANETERVIVAQCVATDTDGDLPPPAAPALPVPVVPEAEAAPAIRFGFRADGALLNACVDGSSFTATVYLGDDVQSLVWLDRDNGRAEYGVDRASARQRYGESGWAGRGFTWPDEAEHTHRTWDTPGQALAVCNQLTAAEAAQIDHLHEALVAWVEAHPAPRIIIEEGDEPPAITLPVPHPGPVPQLRAVAMAARDRDPVIRSAPVALYGEAGETRQVRRVSERVAERRERQAREARHESRNTCRIPTSIACTSADSDPVIRSAPLDEVSPLALELGERPMWRRSPGERTRWDRAERLIGILAAARARIADPDRYHRPDACGCIGADGEYRRPGDRTAVAWSMASALVHELWEASGGLWQNSPPRFWHHEHRILFGTLAHTIDQEDVFAWEREHSHAEVLAALDAAITTAIADAHADCFADWYFAQGGRP